MGTFSSITGNTELIRTMIVPATAMGASGDAARETIGSVGLEAIRLRSDSSKASALVSTPAGWDSTLPVIVHMHFALVDAQNPRDVAGLELCHAFFHEAAPNELLLSKPLDVNILDMALSKERGLSPLTLYTIAAQLSPSAGNNRYRDAGPGFFGLRFRLTSNRQAQQLYLLGASVDFPVHF